MRDAVSCRNCEPQAQKLRHIRNSLAISSLDVRQFLLTVWGITIAALGMAGFAG
jgi:hypothetical protein